jgi:hypothetical protein
VVALPNLDRMDATARFTQARAFVSTLETIATDVARLRRRCTDDYGAHLLDRIAFNVDGLDAAVQPTAAELYADGLAINEALAVVDARARTMRSLLGEQRR